MKALALAILDCHLCDFRCWDKAGLGPFVWAWVLKCVRRESLSFPCDRTVLTTTV